MTSIFLSYARADDEAFARRLHDDLTARGFDVWFDREDMPSRALTFLHEIREAIHARDRLVLVVGPAAVVSDYVEAEWREALELGKPVNPVLRLGDYPLLPDELRLLDTRAGRLVRPGRHARPSARSPLRHCGSHAAASGAWRRALGHPGGHHGYASGCRPIAPRRSSVSTCK